MRRQFACARKEWTRVGSVHGHPERTITVEGDVSVKLIAADGKEYKPTKGAFKKGIVGLFQVWAKAKKAGFVRFSINLGLVERLATVEAKTKSRADGKKATAKKKAPAKKKTAKKKKTKSRSDGKK